MKIVLDKPLCKIKPDRLDIEWFGPDKTQNMISMSIEDAQDLRDLLSLALMEIALEGDIPENVMLVDFKARSRVIREPHGEKGPAA